MHTNTTPTNPAAELKAYAAKFIDRCRSMRWFPALAHAQVFADIATDAEANRAKIEAEAHAAEVADAEADQLLIDVLADGIVTSEEVEQVRTAQRLIRRSATADQLIGQLARA